MYKWWWIEYAAEETLTPWPPAVTHVSVSVVRVQGQHSLYFYHINLRFVHFPNLVSIHPHDSATRGE